jgi:hypothetical protein
VQRAGSGASPPLHSSFPILLLMARGPTPSRAAGDRDPATSAPWVLGVCHPHRCPARTREQRLPTARGQPAPRCLVAPTHGRFRCLPTSTSRSSREVGSGSHVQVCKGGCEIWRPWPDLSRTARDPATTPTRFARSIPSFLPSAAMISPCWISHL